MPPPAGPTATSPAPAVSAGPGAPPAGVQVTLPLAEYDRLVGRPSITVVDTLRLSGSFGGHDLALQLSGRAAGLGPQVEVLYAPASVSIYSCEGDAVLSKSGSGVFELVPLQTRFSLRCRITPAGSDGLQLEITPAILWVESQISDGELVSTTSSSEPGSNRRSISVVRVSGSGGEVLKSSATARYHITLSPEATLFTYRIEVMNPNRSHQPFSLELKSGELVQKVDAAVSFEPVGNEYRFALPPGEQTLTLSGTLPHASFVPPLSASIHYLLIDSHPLLRPNITTSAQHISSQETGLPMHFRGARGFLLADADKVSWQVMRLEAMRTTSFAVSSVRHTFFLSGDGQALGESMLSLDNQGAPALSLPMRAEPSYASLAHEPVLLTRDDKGHLWLPLGHGPQEVLVQHHQGIHRFLGFALGTLWLPELAVPASSASVELRYGREWLPLYEEFEPELRLPVADLGALLGFLLLFIWTERLLSLCGCSRGYRLVVAALLGFGALTVEWWLTLLVATNLGLSALLVWPWLSRRKWNVWTVVGALTSGGVLCLIGVSIMLTGRSMAPMSRSASIVDSRSVIPTEEPPPEKSKASDEHAGSGQYQGLPAKFVLPSGNTQSSFQREMLASSAEAPRAVYVLLLARPALGLIGSLGFCVGLLLLLLRRRHLRQGFLELWQKLRKPPAPTA